MQNRTVIGQIANTNGIKFDLRDSIAPETLKKVNHLTVQIPGTITADTFAAQGSLTGVDTEFFPLEDNSGAIVLSNARKEAQLISGDFGPIPYVRLVRTGAADGALNVVFEAGWFMN